MKICEIIFNNFLKAQVKYMNDAKYYEGINTHHDPGQEYVLKFVEEKAQFFRECWDKSICCKCLNGSQCGDLLKQQCDKFKLIEDIDDIE